MKQEEKNRRSREQIELAAIHGFARQGLEKANLNEICRENEISKGKLYHYYTSKEDLVVACVQRIVDRLVDGVRTFAVDPDQDIAANLHAYYKARIAFWCEDPEALSFVWYCLNLPEGELRERLAPQGQRFNESMKDKTLEIIHAAHQKVNVSDEELYGTMRVMYEHLFLQYMRRIVALNARGDTAGTVEAQRELLTQYDHLIQILLYGILA